MNRAIWIGLMLALAGIMSLCLAWPHEMVSPGNLIPAHSKLQGDCFACHAPFQGASSKRCIACHVIADIGLRTTKGVQITQGPRLRAFHQALTEPDCMACHGDHPKPAWAKARTIEFDHALLKSDVRARCQSCHVPPQDRLHQGAASDCATCHQPSAWKPATFDHARFFPLDRNHNTSCTTCHKGGTYKRYTCFGCHAHQPANIIAEHLEEGITQIDNCVRCHRPTHGEHEGQRSGEDRED